MDVSLLSALSNMTPRRVGEEGWTFKLTGRTEGRNSHPGSANGQRRGERRKRLCAKIHSFCSGLWRSQLFASLSTFNCSLNQMIPKRQVSLFIGGWVTFHGALWGGDDEEFQQQSPARQQPDSQPHQRAKQQKVQLTTLCAAVALFPARIRLLHVRLVPLLLRFPVLSAERRTSKNFAGHPAVSRWALFLFFSLRVLLMTR